MISLALLKEESNVAVLYIDTSNYINSENISSVLKVSFNMVIVSLESYLKYCWCLKEGKYCKGSIRSVEGY